MATQEEKDTAAAKGRQKSSGQLDLDRENEASKNRQKETRDRRQAEREVKDRRKELLQGALSTKERREIKAGVYDLDTTVRPDDNKEGTDERIQNDGIDTITNPLDDSGGGLPDGYVETAVIICVNGSPVSGQFLFKEDTT
tara:strand:+ start:867 stop:1289 length:423 start_codon:yes stop_codon:yes gene_type:complete